MRRKLGELIKLIIGIYFISVAIFISYFNWQFAKENGFLKWLILGQIVPTAKSLVWPYYVFFEDSTQSTADSPSKPIEYTDNDYDFAFLFPSDWKMKKPPEKGEFGEVRVMVQGPRGAYVMAIVGKTAILSKNLNLTPILPPSLTS
jgi:hypothetical protein